MTSRVFLLQILQFFGYLPFCCTGLILRDLSVYRVLKQVLDFHLVTCLAITTVAFPLLLWFYRPSMAGRLQALQIYYRRWLSSLEVRAMHK